MKIILIIFLCFIIITLIFILDIYLVCTINKKELSKKNILLAFEMIKKNKKLLTFNKDDYFVHFILVKKWGAFGMETIDTDKKIYDKIPLLIWFLARQEQEQKLIKMVVLQEGSKFHIKDKLMITTLSRFWFKFIFLLSKNITNSLFTFQIPISRAKNAIFLLKIILFCLLGYYFITVFFI